MDVGTALIGLMVVAAVAYLVTVIHAATVRTIVDPDDGAPPETRLVAWPRWLVGLIAGALALWLLYRVRAILMPFILGALAAYMLDPIIDRMTERGVPRTRAIALVFLICFVLVIAASLLIVPAVVSQAQALAKNYGDYVAGVQHFSMRLEEAATHMGRRMGIEQADVQQAAARLATTAQDWGLGLLQSALTGLRGSVSMILLLVVTPVVAFWLLRDYHDLGDLLLRPLPERHRQGTVEISGDVNRIIGSYLLGILIMTGLVATYSSLVLTILGVRFSILLGIMTGILSIIPYLGFPTAMIIIALTMVITGQSAALVIVAIGLHTLGNLASDNLVYPRVIGGKVGLHPLVVIFAILAGGALLNFVGVILAVPVAGIIKVLLSRFWPEAFPSEEKVEVVKA